MVEISNSLLKLVNGKPATLGSDTIAQSKITDLVTDLGTLTTDVGAAQADATQALSDAADAQATADAALPASGGTITGDLAVQGDLVVEGTIVSKSKESVLISDSFLDLNSGNIVTGGTTAGGLTVNVKASGSAETVTAFVAGVASTSAPTLTVSASTAFVEGDIIQISGALEAKNNGLFVVGPDSSGTSVKLKGFGGTSISANTPFVQSDVVAASGQTATATKVDLAVFAVSDGSLTKAGGSSLAAGTWCFNYKAAAKDSDFAASWIALEAVSVPALTSVLSAGSMIGADQEIGFTASVASAAVKGDLLYQGSDGELKLLDSTVAGGELDAVALEAGGSSKEVASVLGQKVLVGVTGTAPSVGDVLYVSSTAGLAAKVAPTSGRIIKVGKCVGAVSDSLYPVIFQPQIVADISA